MTLRAKLTATFATLVAAFALCAGLATPALAANTISWNDGTLPFTKTATVNGSTVMPDKTFTFTLSPETVASETTGENGMSIVTGLGTSQTVTIKTTEMTTTTTTDSVTGTKESSFSLASAFSGQTLSANTAYRYKLQETDSAGFQVQGASIYIIDVYTNNEGSPSFFIARASNAEGTTTGEKVSSITFTNTDSLKYANLKITKAVAGNLSSNGDTFGFTINLVALDSAGWTSNVSVPAMLYTDGTNGTSVTLTPGTDYTFTLKSGGYLQIDNLPEGMSYNIKELAPGTEYAKGYQPSLVVKENGTEISTMAKTGTTNQELAADANTIKDGGNEVIFTNTRNSDTITGIVLNNAPYIAVFAVAALGIVAFILKRRRNATEEE